MLQEVSFQTKILLIPSSVSVHFIQLLSKFIDDVIYKDFRNKLASISPSNSKVNSLDLFRMKANMT